MPDGVRSGVQVKRYDLGVGVLGVSSLYDAYDSQC